jgi:hypothetical protein
MSRPSEILAHRPKHQVISLGIWRRSIPFRQFVKIRTFSFPKNIADLIGTTALQVDSPQPVTAMFALALSVHQESIGNEVQVG